MVFFFCAKVFSVCSSLFIFSFVAFNFGVRAIKDKINRVGFSWSLHFKAPGLLDTSSMFFRYLWNGGSWPCVVAVMSGSGSQDGWLGETGKPRLSGHRKLGCCSFQHWSTEAAILKNTVEMKELEILMPEALKETLGSAHPHICCSGHKSWSIFWASGAEDLLNLCYFNCQPNPSTTIRAVKWVSPKLQRSWSQFCDLLPMPILDKPQKHYSKSSIYRMGAINASFCPPSHIVL